VPRPITPKFGGDYEIPLDLSPCGQRFEFPQETSPVRRCPRFRYLEMVNKI